MVEINTKKFESAGCFSPSIEHFPLLKELNIPVVSIRMHTVPKTSTAAVKRPCER